MAGKEEIVAIVDRQNRVVGAAPRRQMRAGRLRHRASYILVFNSRGKLFVQKRTLNKDVFPGYYDVAAGGVVLAGESYEAAAARELEEELGVRGAPLKRLFDFYYEDNYIRVWGRVFTCIYDGELVLQAEEVESGAFLEPSAVLRLTAESPSTPDGLWVLRRYLERPVDAATEKEPPP